MRCNPKPSGDIGLAHRAHEPTPKPLVWGLARRKRGFRPRTGNRHARAGYCDCGRVGQSTKMG